MIVVMRGVLKLAKKVKCEVCGKEYLETNPEYGCPYCNEKEKGDRNVIANAMKIVGVIIVIISFFSNANIEVTFWGGLYFFVLHGVYLLAFFAVAEIIQILHDIRRKL